MNNHKNKHIRAAVDYALSRGWRLVLAGTTGPYFGANYTALSMIGPAATKLCTRRRVCRNGTPGTYDGPLTAALTLGADYELRISRDP